MQITTWHGWMKVMIRVDELNVGAVFTDTGQWYPLPLYSALTPQEKKLVLEVVKAWVSPGTILEYPWET